MVVFPATYFGSIAYFKEFAKHENVLLEAKEHFPKQSYRNRCDILGANGMLSLSIPVERPNGSKTSMDLVSIPDTENWRARHWRSIKSAYQSAPFFDYYGMEVEELIMNPETNLLKFNTAIIQRIVSWLDLETRVEHSVEFHPPIENDPRDILGRKGTSTPFETAPYIQVFPGDEGFKQTISILDPIMCIGPLARNLLIVR
ncbi:MAG: WbqC family protein [Crocinitomicaceae bacterium]